MTYNHNYELRLLDQKYQENRTLWLSLGMSEDAIREMYRFDRAVINRDRSYYSHTRQLESFSSPDGEAFDDDQSPLVHENITQMSVTISAEDVFGRFGWITGMQNDALVELLYRLPDDDRELLTALFVDQFTQTEIAVRWGVSCAAINKRYKRILHFLRESLSGE